MIHHVMKEIIGITGGIGSGKSVVSRIMRLRGFGVYDCDYRAHLLMDADISLHRDMKNCLGDDVINCDGSINRSAVAAHIFGNGIDSHGAQRKRKWLNGKVHTAVRDDFCRWTEEDACNRFIESAILHEGELARFCDSIWIVDAPKEIRIGRVCQRSGMHSEEVQKRIDSQKNELNSVLNSGKPIKKILNW